MYTENIDSKGGFMSKSSSAVQHAPSGFVMFVSYFGALVYFINQASGFWEVVGAFFQAIVWPAFVVYYGLQALGV